jgi:hypothetical protein
MAFTQFTEEEYRKRYGQALSEILPNDDDPDSKVERRINLTIEKIEEYVNSRMPSFDIEELPEAIEKYVNRAAMEQLHYELGETDYSKVSGYNALTGSMIPTEQIQKIVICRNAKIILANHVITNGWY